ncbi:MAG TPA: peptide-methionine (S)-S-oxide reductase MsrA [Steroidobacteraceae bacterium]|nr:peptide-methionine (S)-S-oxide reductase MsrA [Steroidobacteraceae bacterium]
MTHRLPMLAAVAAVATLLVGPVLTGRHAAQAAESQVEAPAPVLDEPLARLPGSETAILSGGCFWGMQLVFQHVKGVRQVVSGYTGGAAATAHYEEVGTGMTGHAESIRIVFDPHVISYGALLRVYFSVATDPTELDYQGPDHGSQYRGEIWTLNDTQSRIAAAYLRQLGAAHTFSAPIVTRIDSARLFYEAESYHQNFATLHPDNPYIAAFDAPKLTALSRRFPDLYVARPTLVASTDLR